MKLNCYYDFPYKRLAWAIPFYFDHCFKKLKDKYTDIDFTPINNHTINIKNTAPCYMMNHHWMHIQNPSNKKFITISVWDQLKCAQPDNDYGIAPQEWEQVITSSGVHNCKWDYTPFTYILPHHNSAETINQIRRPNHERAVPERLTFRGKLYAERLCFSKDTRFNIMNDHNNHLGYGSFLKEIDQYSINLSLNGAAEICYRDMEILGLGSALFREKLKCKFHNPLEPNYHYIAFESEEGKPKIESMFDRWMEVKNDIEFINFVAKNGLDWYNKNVSYDNFSSILLDVLQINKLQ